jgi:hypothetical protein
LFISCAWRFGGTVNINGTPTEVGNIQSIEAWQLGVENRFITRSPLGFGDKPASSFTTERLEACLPEAIVTETHQLNFTSKAFENDAELGCQFWNNLRTNYRLYRVGWVDCTGRVYVGSNTIPGFVFVPSAWDHLIPDNNDALQSFVVGIQFKNQGIVCPITIPNFDTAFDVTPIS